MSSGRRSDGRSRPPRGAIATVFGVGVVGTLVPVLGWVAAVWLLRRAPWWSSSEKLAAMLIPLVALLGIVAAAAAGTGIDPRVPAVAAVPLSLSLSCAVASIVLALRLGRGNRGGHR